MPSAEAHASLVTVRYWAGARAAAGVGSDEVPGDSVAAVAAAVGELHPALRPVLAVSSFLIDGATARPEDAVASGATVEILPPFAGG